MGDGVPVCDDDLNVNRIVSDGISNDHDYSQAPKDDGSLIATNNSIMMCNNDDT